jgi:two-component system, cell cycle sensor histidine kinase and response regulator CckA
MPRDASILVVDDDESVRSLTKAVLGSHGYRVLEAESGTRALEIVREAHTAIDLVLTDMVMPGMTGDELSRALHELDPAYRVVFMSGFFDQEYHLPPEAVLLHKPFAVADLIAAVNGALDVEV